MTISALLACALLVPSLPQQPRQPRDVHRDPSRLVRRQHPPAFRDFRMGWGRGCGLCGGDGRDGGEKNAARSLARANRPFPNRFYPYRRRRVRVSTDRFVLIAGDRRRANVAEASGQI
jgi:hypothetical protein